MQTPNKVVLKLPPILLHLTTAVKPADQSGQKGDNKASALIISPSFLSFFPFFFFFLVREINGRRALPFGFSGSSLMQKATRGGGRSLRMNRR